MPVPVFLRLINCLASVRLEFELRDTLLFGFDLL